MELSFLYKTEMIKNTNSIWFAKIFDSRDNFFDELFIFR